MGRRGPAKTPTEVLKRRGSRKGRERDVVEVKADGAPLCPMWLDEIAQECWHNIVPQLEKLGQAKAIDTNALARYCRTWSRWITLQQNLMNQGETDWQEGTKGQTYNIARPETAIVSQLARELAQLEQAFGLTPSARAGRMPGAPEQKQTDALEALKLFGAKERA